MYPNQIFPIPYTWRLGGISAQGIPHRSSLVSSSIPVTSLLTPTQCRLADLLGFLATQAEVLFSPPDTLHPTIWQEYNINPKETVTKHNLPWFLLPSVLMHSRNQSVIKSALKRLRLFGDHQLPSHSHDIIEGISGLHRFYTTPTLSNHPSNFNYKSSNLKQHRPN